MNYKDRFKFVRYELRYSKSEWIASIVMNAIVFACCLMAVIVAVEVGTVCSKYLKKIYTNGYEFYVKGFTEADSEWLEDRGFTFYIGHFDETCAVTDDLNNIWIYKFEAMMQGKDIWSDEFDMTVEVILFGKNIFSAIAILLIVVLTNSNSNSFSMKLSERKEYINMLSCLGMSKKECIGIYILFFVCRNLVSIVIGALMNTLIMFGINTFMKNKLEINYGFSVIRPELILCVFVISMMIMFISFRRIWRGAYEK